MVKEHIILPTNGKGIEMYLKKVTTSSFESERREQMEIKILLWPILIIISIFFTACAPAPAPVPEAPKQFILISSQPDPAPGWVGAGTHENTDSLLYFVGISGELHKEERDALKQARSDASNKFVEYCGVEAKVFSKFIETVSGLSSQLQDTTIAGTSGSTQKAEAYFSRLKLAERYIEKFERSPGEYAYKIKVLVNVPREEYEKVQKWKQQRTAEKQKRAAERMLNTINAIEGLLNSGRSLAQEGNVLGALNHFHQAKTIASESNLAAATLHLTKIEREEKSLTGHLQLQIQENEQQTIEVNQIPKPMVARLIWRDASSTQKPVSDFPLEVEWSIYGMKSSVKKSTDIEGRLTLNLPQPSGEGVIVARVAPDTARLEGQISTSVLRDLEIKEINFRIEVRRTFWQKALGLLGIGSGANAGTSGNNVVKPMVLDFAFMLGTAEASVNYSEGDEVSLYSECAARCYVRLYHLGPDKIITVLSDTNKKQLKNKRSVLFRGTISSTGKHIFLGTASTGKFANRFKAGKEISEEDFMAQIKTFRLSGSRKTVHHFALTVTE